MSQIVLTPEQAAIVESADGYVPVCDPDGQIVGWASLSMRMVAPKESAFTPEEDIPNGPRVAVISYDTWTTRFNGDRDVLGVQRSSSCSTSNRTAFFTGRSFTKVSPLLWQPRRPQSERNLAARGSFTKCRMLRLHRAGNLRIRDRRHFVPPRFRGFRSCELCGRRCRLRIGLGS